MGLDRRELVEGEVHLHEVYVLVHNILWKAVPVPLPQAAEPRDHFALRDRRAAAHKPACAIFCKKPVEVAQEAIDVPIGSGELLAHAYRDPREFRLWRALVAVKLRAAIELHGGCDGRHQVPAQADDLLGLHHLDWILGDESGELACVTEHGTALRYLFAPIHGDNGQLSELGFGLQVAPLSRHVNPIVDVGHAPEGKGKPNALTAALNVEI
mmetsp:Transcript_37399/g.103972  ORF Transcript_37399/g.103972 Transcript_37399/m.103972 type:complete len:212 (-) Transcript_37399:432-1067(-)